MSARGIMFPLSRFLNFSKPSISLCSLRKTSSILCPKKSNLSCIQRAFHTDDPEDGDNSEVPPGMSSRYKRFSEHTSPIILDIEEERQKIQESREETEYDEFHGINLERGVSGVFEIDEVVNILRREKAKDIFVVKIPNEFRYVDYMVIVTAKSGRHMSAICEFIRKVFKKKMTKGDSIPMIEGKGSNSWMALDLGNIALHVFSKQQRELYDLETLWSVGKEYDTHYQQKDLSVENIMTDYADIIANLTPDNESQEESQDVSR